MSRSTIAVVEVYPTVQGEGALAGTPAVFVRLAGCNGWSGRPEGRGTGALLCSEWCDTDFAVRERLTPEELATRARDVAVGAGLFGPAALCVITGGEPGLQLDGVPGQQLVEDLAIAGFRTAVETNGTVDLGWLHLDHVCVSPKPARDGGGGTGHLRQTWGDELKVVVPTPLDLDDLDRLGFDHRFVQPRDDGDPAMNRRNLDLAVREAARLGWRVSVQVHKLLGLP